jgi:DNA modification methylase
MSTTNTLPPETPAEAKSGGGVALQRLVGRHSTATLYLGDCLDVLPEISGVQSVITDPPYGMGRYEATNDDRTVCECLNPWIRKAVFGYPEILVGWCRTLGAPDEWVTWWPTNKFGGRCGKNLPRTSEAIAIWGELYEKPTRERYGDKKCQDYHEEKYGYEQKRDAFDFDVWRDPAPGIAFNAAQRKHPNEKPESLMCKLVKLCTSPGETILDPYMGSGTTGVAAVRLGRNFIGIERDSAHFKTACDRIAHELDGALL